MGLTMGLCILLALGIIGLIALNRTIKKIDEEEKAKQEQEKSDKS